MAIVSGSAKFDPAAFSGWYRAGGAAGAVALGGSVQLRLSALNNIISDIRSRSGGALRASVHAIAVHIAAATTIPSAGAVRYNTRTQRGGVWDLQLEQPGWDKPIINRTLPLSEVDFAGRIMNPWVARLAENFWQTELDAFGDALNEDDPNIGTQTRNVNTDVRPHHDPLSVWMDDDHLRTADQNTGVAVNETFDDVYVIPMCKHSGNLSNDKLPASMLADQGNPWVITVTKALNYNAPTAFLGTATVNETMVDFWVYLTFERKEQPAAYGIPWMYRIETGVVSPIDYNNGLYLVSGVMPHFRSVTVDGAFRFLYEPKNADAGGGTLAPAQWQVMDGKDRLFPFVNGFDTYAQLMQFWNRMAQSGEWPLFRLGALANFNRFSNVVAGCRAYPATNDKNTIIGVTSPAAFIPIVFNSVLAKGFPMGFYARQDDKASRLQVQITGWAIPVLGTSTTRSDMLANDYPVDHALVRRYIEGDCSRALAWESAVENKGSGKAPLVEYLVPHVGM